jgi:hypothetical protein
MIWAAFSGDKKSSLVYFPPDKRKAVDFVELVYKGELLGFLVEINEGILMEDGATVHTSKVSKDWRDLMGIKELNWPACSPDLNPMEQVWAILKCAVQSRRVRSTTIKDLVDILNEEWVAVKGEFLDNLYCSMPDRIQAVIRAKGGHTRY